MRSVSTLKNVTFIYDFAVDGGAVGIFNTGVFVPLGCMPTFLISKSILDIVSGAGVVKIGTAAANTAFLPELGAQLFNDGSPEAGYRIANQINNTITAGGEILFELTVGVITEGAVKFALFYDEF